MNVAYVSRQLGHASISTTLTTYTHLFHAEHSATLVDRLEARFGDVLKSADRPASHQLVMNTDPTPLTPRNRVATSGKEN